MFTFTVTPLKTLTAKQPVEGVILYVFLLMLILIRKYCRGFFGGGAQFSLIFYHQLIPCCAKYFSSGSSLSRSIPFCNVYCSLFTSGFSRDI